MARKPPTEVRRMLKSAKIWKGAVYVPGMEDELPSDFPMDGPHWDDYIPDPEDIPEQPKGLAGARLQELRAAQETSASAPGVVNTGTGDPVKVAAKKGSQRRK